MECTLVVLISKILAGGWARLGSATGTGVPSKKRAVHFVNADVIPQQTVSQPLLPALMAGTATFITSHRIPSRLSIILSLSTIFILVQRLRR